LRREDISAAGEATMPEFGLDRLPSAGNEEARV